MFWFVAITLVIVGWKWPPIGWTAAAVIAPMAVALLVFCMLVRSDYLGSFGTFVALSSLGYAGVITLAGFAGRRFRRGREATAEENERLTGARVVSRWPR